MRNRVGIAPAIAVIAAFVLPWNSAPDARARAVSDHFALHVLRLKPPPVTAYRNAGGFVRRYWGDFSPTGVDGAVNMVMFDGCCNVIRYSIG
ncbi:MAG TPA: hypothetical protein VG815_15735, partial [Chloroflexota bacterium]|nr:hypothetical protein [Chloroflexota bacterium]